MNDEFHNVLSADIQLNKEDYLKYDLEKINDRALAVRDILKSGGISKKSKDATESNFSLLCSSKIGNYVVFY